MDNPTYAYDGKIKQIDHIDFDILPNDEIRNRSAVLWSDLEFKEFLRTYKNR